VSINARREEEARFSGPTLLFGLALTMVPIFSSLAGFSFLPQVAAGLSLATALPRFPSTRLHGGFRAYLALVAFFGISLVTGDNPEWTSYLSIVKVALFALAGHLIVRNRRQLFLVMRMVVVSSPIALAINFGSLSRLVSEGARPQRWGSDWSEAERFAGTFGNPNSAGVYAIIIVLFSILLISAAPRGKKWLYALIGIAPALIVVWFSGSRKAMLGIAVVGMFRVSAAAFKPRGRRIMRSAAAFLGAGSLLGFGVFLFFSYSPFAPRLLAVVASSGIREASLDVRREMATEAVRLWRESPLWGNGWEGFRKRTTFGAYSHSTFTETLCNGGLLGFGLWALTCGSLVVSAWGLWRRRRDAVRRQQDLMILGLAALIVLFSALAVILDDRLLIPIVGCLGGYLMGERQRPAVDPLGKPLHKPRAACELRETAS
jgi:hypothetical protein